MDLPRFFGSVLLGVDEAQSWRKLRVTDGPGTPLIHETIPPTATMDRPMTDSQNLLIYEKPTCTTCRKLVKLLKEQGIEFDRLNYFIDPIPREKLEELLGKMELRPRDLLRKREKRYKEMGLKDPGVGDEEILDALVEYPELIERPIIERGNRAVLGRPVERVLELL
jgi:arsenate reductase